MTPEEYCQTVSARDLANKTKLASVAVAEDESPLVDLKSAGLDLVFAPSLKTTPVWVREGLVPKLSRISTYLSYENLKLAVCAGWRSQEAQRLVWQKTLDGVRQNNPDTPINSLREMLASFVASDTGSMHLTGGAIDALIYDPATKRVLNFGTNTGFDITLGETCYPFHPETSAAALYNRKLLINLFEQEDFVLATNKYWHFDYGNRNWALQKGKQKAIYGIVPAAPGATETG